MLSIYVGSGVHLKGIGSHQTRIFWEGDPEPVPDGEDAASTDRNLSYSALLTFYMGFNGSMEGLTLDAGNTQETALRLHHWPGTAKAHKLIGGDPFTGSDGSNFLYRDIHFTNATAAGFSCGSQILGSERTFISCRFTNNTSFGIIFWGQNALNYSFFGCHFEGGEYGIKGLNAGHCTITGCTFTDNSIYDMQIQLGPSRVVNCSSTSQHFFMGDGLVVACRHIYGSEGKFTQSWDNTGTVLVGNYSSNGRIHDETLLFLKM